MAPDGEEQDAYLPGVKEIVDKFTVKIIAIVYRNDDIEENWMVVADDVTFAKEDISVGETRRLRTLPLISSSK